MKAKYIFASLVAALALLAGCTKEAPTYLDEVQVTSSYVSVPLAGGSSTIKVNATDAWSIGEIPAWLTVSPLSGNAGETTVSFSADGALDGRESTVILTCKGVTQRINVIQGVAVVSAATCAEILAGPDSKNYRVTGICTRISNTQYGNWYIDDGTGEVYIYGTVNASGSYAWSSFNIEVGDEVTVEGPKSTYQGTVELVDATFISVSKSLIKVEETDPADGSVGVDGGAFKVLLSNKGNGVYVRVPESAKSWLSIGSVQGNVIVFEAAKNEGGPRVATLTIETTDGKKTYTTETTVSQAGAIGTLEKPFTVEQAIAFAKGLGGDSPMDVYVEGIISKIENNGAYSAQYGNATFWISADGTHVGDTSKEFEAYRVLYLGNKKWVEGQPQIAVGDKVILCGKTTVYKTTAETVSGKAWIYSHNGKTQ